MPINYSKPGMKRPGIVTEWTAEQVKEIMKCGTDITYFAENYYNIVHPKRGQMIITLHDFQKEMLKNFVGYQNNVVLSARQVGKALSLDTPILTMSTSFIHTHIHTGMAPSHKHSRRQTAFVAHARQDFV